MNEHWFSSAKKQAFRLVGELQKEDAIDSVRTFENFKSRLQVIAQRFKDLNLPSMNNLTPNLATDYLINRALEVSQSTLNMERQAMQLVMQNLNGNLKSNERLPVVKSELEQVLSSRAYTTEQVQLVAQHQRASNALATEVAYAAGLRAHEILTLRPTVERCPDLRETHKSKFNGREGKSYTVAGKGGLTREIRLPNYLSERLEKVRLPKARKVTDRTVHYLQYYEIGGGQKWSNSFCQASGRACGWSNGAHGVRHSYAQERMSELQKTHPRDEALLIVSQEMGHFRPEITEVYLR